MTRLLYLTIGICVGAAAGCGALLGWAYWHCERQGR